MEVVNPNQFGGGDSVHGRSGNAFGNPETRLQPK